jgi:DNA polymerase-3 subunit epsilon
MVWWPIPRNTLAVDERRWLVVDVEASGLDAAGDRLLAIAALGLQVDWAARRVSIVLGDSFEVVLRQDHPSTRDNILLHGIGAARQADGVAAADALAGFARFAGSSPLLAFHAAFDETLVGRVARHVGIRLPNPWLDIEQLCAVTQPGAKARALDEWMAVFGIRCAARHRAAADALAEAELLLRIWPPVAAECRSWKDVRRLAARHRWLARG